MDKKLNEFVRFWISNTGAIPNAQNLAEATLKQLISEAEIKAMQKASDKLDDLHQGTEGAGFVHYGEMGEWFDDELAALKQGKGK